MSEKLAVVTVTYSPGRHLASFIGSLDAATTSDTLVILADNGSTDGVPEAAAAAQDSVEFHPTGGNIGYGGGINYAIDRVRERMNTGEVSADFVLISNPDVVFSPGSIDELLACARRWPTAAAIGPRIEEADGTAYPSARAVPTLVTGIGHALLGGIWKNNPFSRHYHDDDDMDTERTAGWLSGSCLLVRMEAFDRVGGFDERYFMYMEDVDLGDRFGQAGFVNVFCPTAVIRHAKGHAAGAAPTAMLKAHHKSAYRFQADRHPHTWQAPLRGALKVGLKIREVIAVTLARRGQ